MIAPATRAVASPQDPAQHPPPVRSVRALRRFGDAQSAGDVVLDVAPAPERPVGAVHVQVSERALPRYSGRLSRLASIG